jgi:hypothetical protein
LLVTNEQKQQLRKALETAIQRRDELTSERAEIEAELTQQNKAISALSNILGEISEPDIGFTDAILMAIRNAPTPLTPTEIRDELLDNGYNIDKFSNAMASLHQVLIRLKERKLIGLVASKDKKKRFAAIEYPSAEKLRKRIAESMERMERKYGDRN